MQNNIRHNNYILCVDHYWESQICQFSVTDTELLLSLCNHFNVAD